MDKQVKLITVGTFAKTMDCSTRKIWGDQDAGRCPKSLKIGGSVRWRDTDIQEWIADGCPNVAETGWTPKK